MNTKIYNKDVGIINKIDNYLKPELIYIPLEENNITYEHIVKEGDYIYKGDIVAVNKELNLKKYSSVSGYALYGSNKTINTGKKVRCIVIENDYKEKIRKNKKENYHTKEELIKLLLINKIKLIDNYIYKKTSLLVVNIDQTNKINKIILDSYIELLLETIDKLSKTLEIPNAVILTNKKINKYTKSYPNIKIKSSKKYYPKIRNDIIISNINEIYEIMELLKNNPISEKIISIDNKETNKIIKVKIGTLLSDIIDDTKECQIIINSLSFDYSVNTSDIIITKDIDSFIIKSYL